MVTNLKKHLKNATNIWKRTVFEKMEKRDRKSRALGRGKRKKRRKRKNESWIKRYLEFRDFT